MRYYLIVEGNTTKQQGPDLTQAFQQLFKKLQIKHKPRVVAAGGRHDALREYIKRRNKGDTAILLIDSERAVPSEVSSGPPKSWNAWAAVNYGGAKGVTPPKDAPVEDCQLCLQAMEAWYLAAKGYEKVEQLSPSDALAKVKAIHQHYRKGDFHLLFDADPAKIIAASPWAARFFDEVQARGTHASA
ncbi:MAG: hypothetical protein EAZ99_17630 [Alphaproteobacteria bacterium]|nr:MAG: hypothetical protein EAZ99_17630 [Alphaproteobacteria bacterium]